MPKERNLQLKQSHRDASPLENGGPAWHTCIICQAEEKMITPRIHPASQYLEYFKARKFITRVSVFLIVIMLVAQQPAPALASGETLYSGMNERKALQGTPLEPPTHNGKSLVVDQAAQKLRLYEDGVEVLALSASTGAPGSYTPAYSGYVGPYKKTIVSDDGLKADHAWYLFMNHGKIYIHGAPYTLSKEGTKIYIGLEFLGVAPVSHGCIRLFPADIEWLNTWNPEGVPILITPPVFE
jgi:hypothetical protein